MEKSLQKFRLGILSYCLIYFIINTVNNIIIPTFIYGLKSSLYNNKSFVVKSPIGQLPYINQNNIFTINMNINNNIKLLFVNNNDANDTDNKYIKCI